MSKLKTLAALAIALCLTNGSALAHDDEDAATLSADEWFSKPSEDDWYDQPDEEEADRARREARALEKARKKAEKVARREKRRARFLEIHKDDVFTYYMDRRTARRINVPHMEEKMIDVWVKLEPNEAEDGEQKYFLEHYYIRPKRQVMQFMCELEVSGRPTNDIEENRYNPSKWEPLIPGSIEDTIYHAVMKNTGSIREEGVGEEGTSIRDFIEKTVNVSL